MKKYIIILLLALIALPSKAQQEEQTNILFLIDASFSMRKNWDTKSKWLTAKETVVEVADSLQHSLGSAVHFGIRVYGHQSMPIYSNCKDSELILPIAKNSTAALKSKLEAISPKGITPLAYSLEQTKNDFAGLQGKNILILITDGAESCQGDPCRILKILMEDKVILKPFIIGLDIPIESLQAYACVQGEVFNEKSQKNFKKRLHKTLLKAMTYTSVQVNLLTENKQPIQTNKTMFFYSQSDGKLKYTYYHKLDKNKRSDTLYLVPDKYKIVVKTIPETVLENVSLDAARHNVISIDAPTGSLNVVFVDGNGKEIDRANPFKYVIKKQKEHTYLHQEYMGNAQEYKIGMYDIDVLSLPPIQKIDIDIQDQRQTILRVAAPGQLNLRSRLPIHGALFVKNVESLINIYSLKPKTTQEILDLQPGEYELVYRLSSERKMIKTKSISFTIKALETTRINL